MKRLLDLQETAIELGFSIYTIRKWVRKGWIPHVRFGRKIFLRVQDIEDVIKKHLVPCKENARQQNDKKGEDNGGESAPLSEEAAR